MKIVGYQISLRITRLVILVIRPDYQKFCLRSTPATVTFFLSWQANSWWRGVMTLVYVCRDRSAARGGGLWRSCMFVVTGQQLVTGGYDARVCLSWQASSSWRGVMTLVYVCRDRPAAGDCLYVPTLIFWFRCKKLIYRSVLQNWMKIVGYQISLRITRFVILVIRPDYQKFCLRSTPATVTFFLSWQASSWWRGVMTLVYVCRDRSAARDGGLWYSCMFVVTGQQLVTGGYDARVCLSWQVSSWWRGVMTLVYVCRDRSAAGDGGLWRSCMFVVTGQQLVTGGYDARVCLSWQASSSWRGVMTLVYVCRDRPAPGDGGLWHSCMFVVTGQQLVTGGYDARVCLSWQASSSWRGVMTLMYVCRDRPAARDGGLWRSCMFVVTGQQLVTGGYDARVCLSWQVSSWWRGVMTLVYVCRDRPATGDGGLWRSCLYLGCRHINTQNQTSGWWQDSCFNDVNCKMAISRHVVLINSFFYLMVNITEMLKPKVLTRHHTSEVNAPYDFPMQSFSSFLGIQVGSKSHFSLNY